MARRALAIAAHPDDIEFMMAGTLLRLQKAGWEIHYMNLATGNQGTAAFSSAEITRIRREEAKAACELAGAFFHEAVADDLEIFYNRDLLAKVGATVREVAPEIILTHYLQDYMEDHSTTGRLAVTAAFSRAMVNFVTNPQRPVTGQNIALYHALPYGLRDPYGRLVEADFFVNIEEEVELKVNMLACHKSQKDWLDVSQGYGAYLQTLRDICRQMGALSKRYSAAEGWLRHNPLGLCPSDFNPLMELDAQ